jgi:large subunit ribosomal protein L15
MENNQIRMPKGANRNKKIVGRGRSTGWGKTSGRGHKGQKSRSGGSIRPGFEGGQMPLYRRVAARGFSNHPFKKEYLAVNLNRLEAVYTDGEVVNLETLQQKGLIKKSEVLVKILGTGDLTKKLDVQVDRVSAAAAEKIKKAGGKVLVEPAKAEKKQEKPAAKTEMKAKESAPESKKAEAKKAETEKPEDKKPAEKKAAAKKPAEKKPAEKKEAAAKKPAVKKTETAAKKKPAAKKEDSAKKEDK